MHSAVFKPVQAYFKPMHQRERRSYVIVAAVASTLFLLLWTLQLTEPVFLSLLLLTSVLTYTRLLLEVTRLGYRERKLDERQRELRNRAVQMAHTIIVRFLTVTTAVLFLATGDFGSPVSGLSADKPTIFFVLGGLTVQIALLPKLIVAWLEPDPAAEDAEVGGVQTLKGNSS